MSHTSFFLLAGGSSSPTKLLCLVEPLGRLFAADALLSTFSLPRCSSELSMLKFGISNDMFESLLGVSRFRVVLLAC